MDKNTIPNDVFQANVAVRASIKRLWRQGEACEVLLQAEPGPGYSGPYPPPPVRAHRPVLMAGSPYLYQRLRFTMGPCIVIPIQGVEPGALYSMVEYMYDAESLALDGDNVESVLACATQLQMEAVRANCSAFLAATLAPDSALRIASIAERHRCEVLACTAERFVEEHFGEVAQTDAFAALEADMLCCMLQREGVRESSAVQVLDAVLRWANRDWAARREQLCALLQHVDLPRVPPLVLAERAKTIPDIPPDVAEHICNVAARHYLLHARHGEAACPCARAAAPPRAAPARPRAATSRRNTHI